MQFNILAFCNPRISYSVVDCRDITVRGILREYELRHCIKSKQENLPDFEKCLVMPDGLMFKILIEIEVWFVRTNDWVLFGPQCLFRMGLARFYITVNSLFQHFISTY